MLLCDRYCSHGGRCELEPHHPGDHDSGYCQWTDAESLTRTQADAVLAGKPGGADYLRYEAPVADFIEGTLGDE